MVHLELLLESFVHKTVIELVLSSNTQLFILNVAPLSQENQKQAPPVPKKPGKGKPVLGREKSGEAADKQRQEARKRLMAAKRAQSVKQNSATESADSIEIYVPEAQTRL